MVIQTLVFGIYSLQSEQRKILSLQEKQMTALVVSVKNWSFQVEIGILETFTCHWKLDSLPIHPHGIAKGINKCDFLHLT